MELSVASSHSCGDVPGSPKPEPSIEDYTIGWICALQEEYEAACRMLDDEFDGPEAIEANDNNTYAFGRIGGHNVVIGSLPNGQYGTSSAASVARDMVRSFANIRFALMVGIGGGAPTHERDIRLGDVVVSVPYGELGGVVQYDLGKRLSTGRFQRTGQLNSPPQVLLGAIPEMRRRHNDLRKSDRVAEHLKLMADMLDYQHPAQDRLYRADYEHNGGKNCENCEVDGLEERPRRETNREVTVHYGIIASANSIMKNATERDLYSKDPELNVLCFEMEAGGLMNNFPCIVIRGICDYSDSHKNDDWHKYAALTAAAYARELLLVLKPKKVAVMPSWAGKMEAFLATIQEGVKNASRKADDIIRHQHDQENEKILKWLTPMDYARQQSDFIERRQPGTGQWLLESAKYQAWLKNSKQRLFCPGIPGAGKTILASTVVHNLYNRFRNDNTVGLAYLYCNFQRQSEQKVELLLSNLLKQLAQCLSPLPGIIKELYNRHETRQTRPLLAEISGALQSIAVMYSEIFIVLDALDECQDTNGSRGKLLAEIFSLQDKSLSNLFVTSRFIPEVTKEFRDCPSIEIRANHDDIWSYLHSHMSQLPEFVLEDACLQMEIKSEIEHAIEGMFLLAKLHLDSLVGKRSPAALRKALKGLRKASKASQDGSSALYDVYEKAMDRIQCQRGDLPRDAMLILSWIVHSKRPITIPELQHALAVEVGTCALDKDNIPTVDHMVRACAPLVTVDNESNIFRLVHYTAQEYFERSQKNWFPDAQKDIATTCITYLSFDAFEAGMCLADNEFTKRVQLNPLYEYAAQNWGYHARHAEAEVEQLVLGFLESKAKVSAASQVMMASGDENSGYWRMLPRQMTGLHLATYFGLVKATVALLEHGHALDPRDGFYSQTPLSHAAENGHKGVVELLLAKTGIDINSTDIYLRTPLSYAAENGHETVVKLLLTKDKVIINSKDWHNRTPLSLAAENGNEAVVKLLLAKDKVQLNSKDGDNRAPLSYAIENGHEVVVKLLLEKGAELETKDNESWTPLSWAAINGHKAVAKLLLEKGAKLESKDIYGQTPLTWATRNGHETVVKLLLENGAELESKDSHGQTPLSWATRNGQEAVVELLLKNGAELETKDRYGQTPLSWTIKRGKEYVVELLLKNGAKLESKDNLERTPLSWAAARGDEGVVKLLLAKNNINPNQRDRFGLAPIFFAAKNGHPRVVKLLLEKCRENGVVIRDEDINILTPPAAYDQSRVICDICLSSVFNADMHYHCGICEKGDFDICQECITSGYRCLDYSHELVQRIWGEALFEAQFPD